MVTSGSARRRERRSGRLTSSSPGGSARGEQHRQLVLAHEVEQVEQDALVADAGVQVLDQQRAGGAGHVRLAQRAGRTPAAPDFRRQTLARCVLPARGGATTSTERCGQSGQRSMMSAAAWLDRLIEEILRPQRRAVRQIEDELIGRAGHGVSLALARGAAGAAALPL